MLGILGSSLFLFVFLKNLLSARRSLFFFFCGIALSSLIVIEVLGAGVAERIDMQGITDSSRASAYRSTLEIIKEAPWFGTGLGTFQWTFPSYRSLDLSVRGRWDRAHSTPLEICAEMGIPMCLLVLVAWGGIAYVFARAIHVNVRKAALPIAAATIFLTVSLHSAIDFSLQTPGLAVIAFAAIGGGLAQSLRVLKGERRSI
jgi:O-antigen ligase